MCVCERERGWEGGMSEMSEVGRNSVIFLINYYAT